MDSTEPALGPRTGPPARTAAVLSGVTAAALLAALSLAGGGAATAQAAAKGLVRFDQAGYADNGTKEAFLLTKSAVDGATWKLVGSDGGTAASGRTGASLGRWNAAYPAVYPIDFSAVTYRRPLPPGGRRRRDGHLGHPRHRPAPRTSSPGPPRTPPPSSRPSATAPT